MSTGQLRFDHRKNGPGGANSSDAQLLKNFLVLWVIQSRNSAFNLKVSLRHLTNDDIIFVFTGDGNNHICTAYADLFHSPRLAGIAAHYCLPQFLFEGLITSLAFLQEQDLMPPLQQVLSEVVANVAATSYDNIHTVSYNPFLILPLLLCFLFISGSAVFRACFVFFHCIVQ